MGPDTWVLFYRVVWLLWNSLDLGNCCPHGC